MVVIGSVLAVGTAHAPTLMVVATLSIAAGVLAMGLHHRDTGKWPIGAPALGIMVLTIWTALQALRMPSSWLAAVAPSNWQVWSRALAPLGEAAPRWMSISLDPGASWLEVLKGVSYLGIVMATTVIASRRGAVFGMLVVFAAALSAGVMTMAHGLAGLDRVFGLYEPENHFATWHIGPLLNANHLAGYLNLGAMCGLGLLMMRKPVIPPWLTALGVTTLVAVAITSVSRAALVLLPLGATMVVLLVRRRAAVSDAGMVSRKALHWLTVSTFGGGVILALLGLTTRQWDELNSRDLSKLQMLEWARPMIEAHKWLGIGRGSFETVYPAYRAVPGNLVWTHPENVLVQWLAEWGLPMGAAAILFFGWLMLPKRMGATRSAVAAGGWAGLVILALQNLVDFSLEMPSVAIAALTVMGSAWGDTARRGLEPLQAREPLADGAGDGLLARVRRGYGPALYATVGLVALGLAWWQGLATAGQDIKRLDEVLEAGPMRRDQFVPLAREAMLRHPAEPYFSLVGAVRAWRVRDDNPIPYVQRVLERSRRSGHAHLLLAEVLFARRAQAQALLELKFACDDDPALITPAVALAIHYTTDHQELARMVPATDRGPQVLSVLGAWLNGRAPEAAAKFDEEALRRDPGLVAPRERLADRVLRELALGESGTLCKGPDKRKQCAELIEREAAALQKAAPQSTKAAKLRARALVALDRPQEADEILRVACTSGHDRLECLRTWIEVAARLKNEALVNELVAQIGSLGCGQTRRCAATQLWLGDFFKRWNNWGSAVNAYERAVRHDPTDAVAWKKLGEAASKLGTSARAVEAFRRALELDPGNKHLEDRLEQERSKMFRSLLR